ncbi:hypothetical protein DJ564_27880 [Pseudomonas sp. 31-12]|nr:hypothetical protein DJ564_27880 [Pseudomonas sp. 31-12]
MARALNKNKKPESKIKIEHATTFLGSFGSPCSFWRLSSCSSCYTVRYTNSPSRHPLQVLAQLPTPSPD